MELPFIKLSNYSKNVLKLFTGSGLATLIGFAIQPILTRIYPPSAFGDFQLLLSIITIFANISTFQYDSAIVLPKYLKEYRYLYAISLINLFFSTILFLFLFYFLGDLILSWLNAIALKPYLIYCIAGIFVSGLLQIARNVLMYNGKFKQLAINSILESTVRNGSGLAIGLYSPSFVGLTISYIAGIFTSVLVVIFRLPPQIKKLNIKHLKLFYWKYRKFAIVNTPGAVIHVFTGQLPVLMLAKFYGAEVVGFYQLANRYINIPLGLVGDSVAKAFYKESSKCYHESIEKLKKLYIKTCKQLAIAGIIPSLIVIGFAPPLVSFIFGKQWTEGGIYMQIIMLGFYARLIGSPVSNIYLVINKQEILTTLMILFAVLKFAILYYCGSNNYDVNISLYTLSALNVIFYILIAWMGFKLIKSKK